MPTHQGSIRLFRAAGIVVFLHWSWFLVAAYEINGRGRSYSSVAFNALEYLALFLIVLMHEFGHSLACRQVGGTANQIVLWPLGGVAYVDPPPRPGATLWSIAAGPLVNVALLPILLGLGMLSRSLGWAETMPNFHQLLRTIAFINLSLLIFNLLPIYPLDGGQILRSLLWFVLGRARSLLVATVNVDELLERPATRAVPLALGKIAASRWLRLSPLQDRATCGRLLEVRPVRSAFRHLPNPGRLPPLRSPICREQVFGLRRTSCSE
jgi:Zn-dependent protease